MATTMVFRHECGAVSHIFVPKQTQVALLGNDTLSIADALLVDAAEEEAGEVDDARFFAETVGAQFIDTRELESFCDQCGEPVLWERGLSDCLARERHADSEDVPY
jgi:hypothetical protein